MLKAAAERAITQAWLALPASERKTEAQAATFAMTIMSKYPFRTKGDPFLLLARACWFESGLGHH